MGTGMVVGYSATLLPQLQPENNGTVTANQEEASWIASVAVLPMTLGSILGSFLLEKFGRRSAHIIICLPKTLGWLLITFANSVTIIIFGRILTGLCIGVLCTITGVYISEICSPEHRGFLLTAITAAFSVGLALVHFLGAVLSWKITACISSILPLISWALLLLSYESPAYLAKNNKIEDARKSHYWLHGESETSKADLEHLFHRQEEAKNEQTRTNFTDFFTPQFLKPLTIISVFFVVTQCSGPNIMNFYSVTVIKKTVGDSFSEHVIMIIVDMIRVVASVIACILARKFHRRPLAITSGIGTFSSLFTLSFYGYILRIYPQAESQCFFIPIIALILYIFFISLAFVPLPWVVMGELLPLWGRSVGSGISTFIQSVSAFVVVKTSLSLFENQETAVGFLLFGSGAFIATVFVYFCLPETKGKTLEEIEEHFKGTADTKIHRV